MATRAVRVEKRDGTTFALDHVSHRWSREFGVPDMLQVFVPREDASGASLDEDEDEVYVEVGGSDLTGGLLRSIQKNDGSTTELVVDSFEAYAQEAEPQQPTRRENAQAGDIVKEAIGFVDELSEGNIDTGGPPVSFVFSHASPAKWMRTAEQASDFELEFNADKTVDFKTRVGQDRSSSVTISAANRNIDEEIVPSELSRTTKATHLRMLGPGEGIHQEQVNVVPQSDPDAYENKATHAFGDWQPGDRKIWAVTTNKNDTSLEALEAEGLSLVEELNEDHVEVRATIKGEDIDFGDTVRVQKPDERIDRDLRAVDWERVDDYEGLRYNTVLSTRKKTRERSDAQIELDRDRYNKAFEGVPVTMTAGGGRQPVDQNVDYEFEFYYPDEVEFEHRVRLFVKGLAYRAYSKGGATGGGDHSHDVSIDIPDHNHTVSFSAPNHTHGVDINETSEDNTEFSNLVYVESGAATAFNLSAGTPRTVFTFNTPTFQTNSFATLDVRATMTDPGFGVDPVVGFSLFSDENFEYYPDSDGQAVFFPLLDYDRAFTGNPTSQGSTTILVNEDISDDDVRVVANSSTSGVDISVIATLTMAGQHTHDLDINETTESGGFFSVTDTTNDGGSFQEASTTAQTNESNHSHPPEPGVIEAFSGSRFYPSGCDVVVNGQSKGLSLGDGNGEFEEEVDLSGLLTPGAVNTVRITSNTLGHIQSNLDIDVYRQILGDG